MPSATVVTQAGSSRLLAVDLDQAEPAGADVGEAVEVAERRDRDAVLPGRVEDRLARAGAVIELAVDRRGS